MPPSIDARRRDENAARNVLSRGLRVFARAAAAGATAPGGSGKQNRNAGARPKRARMLRVPLLAKWAQVRHGGAAMSRNSLPKAALTDLPRIDSPDRDTGPVGEPAHERCRPSGHSFADALKLAANRRSHRATRGCPRRPDHAYGNAQALGHGEQPVGRAIPIRSDSNSC